MKPLATYSQGMDELTRPELAPLQGGIAVLDPVRAHDVEEEIGSDDGEIDYTGWFAIKTDPFPCPAEGCDFIAKHMTAGHLVVVWEERDDPNLLLHAGLAQKALRNPRVVPYEVSQGKSVSYYLWEASGRPVHAVRGKS